MDHGKKSGLNVAESVEQNLTENWINEERIFNHKCCLVYEAYLEMLYPGWIDHYSDTIVDALLTYWKSDEKLDRIHAQTVAQKWLIPTLNRIRPPPAWIFYGAPTSAVQCPHCGKTMTVPKDWKGMM